MCPDKPSLDCRLAGRVLSEAGADDVAHDDVVDFIRRNVRFVQHRFDASRTELRGRNGGERTPECSDRRTHTSHDERFVVHD